MILTQLYIASGKRTLVPFNLTADAAYILPTSNFTKPGWTRDGSTDFVGANGIAAFYYADPAQGGQTHYSTAARTKHLPYDVSLKYYFEISFTTNPGGAGDYVMYGIAGDDDISTTYDSPAIFPYNGAGYGGLPNIPGGAFKMSDTLMIAYKPATNEVFFGKNGVWPVDPVSGAGATIQGIPAGGAPRMCLMQGGGYPYSQSEAGYFKSTSLSYPVPTGYIALAS